MASAFDRTVPPGGTMLLTLSVVCVLASVYFRYRAVNELSDEGNDSPLRYLFWWLNMRDGHFTEAGRSHRNISLLLSAAALLLFYAHFR